MTNASTPDSACDRTTLALPWLLNGSLPAPERREVREHLIHCPQCRAELARTRETLAVFATAAVVRTEAAPVAATGGNRFATRGRVIRHFSWAAMIAALVAAVSGTWLVETWLAGTRATPTVRGERSAPPRQAEVSTPARVASVSTPTAVPRVSAPKPPAGPATPRRRPEVSTPPGPAPVQPEVIFMTSFESGTVEALANGAVKIAAGSSTPISTADFENGELAVIAIR